MPNKLMTLEEKTEIGLKAIELKKQGDLEGYHKLMMLIPVPAYTAKSLKEVWKLGDWLKTSGHNLAEAEAAFGPDWLDK